MGCNTCVIASFGPSFGPTDNQLPTGLPALKHSIAIVIVQDHLALRKGLELLLCTHGHRVVGATHSPSHALRLVQAYRPDVALVDIDLADGLAIGLTPRLLTARPDLGVLLYSAGLEPDMVADALAGGARGVALKTGSPEELLGAIAAVGGGATWMDPRLPRIPDPWAAEEVVRRLSGRESEVLGLLADGMTGQAIADELFLSPETVRTHVRNAMRKLGARTRSQAIAIVEREGRQQARSERLRRTPVEGPQPVGSTRAPTVNDPRSARVR